MTNPNERIELDAAGLEAARKSIIGNPFNDEQLSRLITAYLSATPQPQGLGEPVADHSDDRAVDAFAAAMKAKLAEKRAQGYAGWDNRAECSEEHLNNLLGDHLEKGDPLDVGNFCMMLHQRGERITK